MNNKLKPIALLFVWFLVLLPNLLFAADFHIRAREHFDRITLDYGELTTSEDISGIGPTINFWLEEPYNWAAGMFWGLTYISNHPDKNLEEVGENMEMQEVGIEIKYWMINNEGGPFTRFGLSQLRLQTQGNYGELKTTGGQFALGWEFKFSKIGLAFEVGKRELSFDHGIGISLISPAIGVHFYGYI